MGSKDALRPEPTAISLQANLGQYEQAWDHRLKVAFLERRSSLPASQWDVLPDIQYERDAWKPWRTESRAKQENGKELACRHTMRLLCIKSVDGPVSYHTSKSSNFSGLVSICLPRSYRHGVNHSLPHNPARSSWSRQRKASRKEHQAACGYIPRHPRTHSVERRMDFEGDSLYIRNRAHIQWKHHHWRH